MIVIQSNHAQLVIENTSVMNRLKLYRMPSKNLHTQVSCLRSSDGTRRRLPDGTSGLLGIRSNGLLNVYCSYIIVCIGLCTNPSLAAAEARKTLMELLPFEECERGIKCLSELDLFGGHIRDVEL